VAEAQGLEQEGRGGFSPTQDEEMGPLAIAWVQAEVHGPLCEQDANGAILIGKGLEARVIAVRWQGQGRGWLARVHQDQPLGWSPQGLVMLAGGGDQGGNEVGSLRRIGQDQDLGLSDLGPVEVEVGTQPGPMAIPAQRGNHLPRQVWGTQH